MYNTIKKIFFVISVLITYHSPAQNISKLLQDAYLKFESDSQLSNAISSLYVINANTGEVVFDKNSRIGLATASTLKIVTAATAYELLGRDFRYQTQIGYDGKIEKGVLSGNIIIVGCGDPTLGSWRYKSTNDTGFVANLMNHIVQKGIKLVDQSLIIDDSKFDLNPVPHGWIWEDIGNYYGAGSWGFNWHENQFDIRLKSGKNVGDSVRVIKKEPDPRLVVIINELKSGKKGTGDNAYAYISPFSQIGLLQGTIPIEEDNFSISASLPDPLDAFKTAVKKELNKKSIQLKGDLFSNVDYKFISKAPSYELVDLFTHYSPSLDSIIYWFLKKSINLYGEALTKTFAYQKNGFGETGKGVEIIKNFWKEKGIASTELNIVDGSGLSPLNRVTTHAQVTVLKYAKSQPWFNGYYDAFPEYNGMKMKSGTINDVKGFCGYQKSKDGNEYIFSFLVNNYNGSSSAVVQKMYRVLDELK